MFRLAQLREIQHELNRARAIAESLQLTDIARDIHESLTKIHTEIQRTIPTVDTGTKAPRGRKTTVNQEENI